MTSQSVKKLSVSMNLKIFTSKIQLNQKTLKQRIRSQSSESKWFRIETFDYPLKLLSLIPKFLISSFEFSRQNTKLDKPLVV